MVPCPTPKELAELAERSTAWPSSCNERISVIDPDSNNEQKAVLASMAEGVLAVDSQERMISLNTASAGCWD